MAQGNMIKQLVQYIKLRQKIMEIYIPRPKTIKIGLYTYKQKNESLTEQITLYRFVWYFFNTFSINGIITQLLSRAQNF